MYYFIHCITLSVIAFHLNKYINKYFHDSTFFSFKTLISVGFGLCPKCSLKTPIEMNHQLWVKAIQGVTWISVTVLDSKVLSPFGLAAANQYCLVLLCLCSREHLLQCVRETTTPYVLTLLWVVIISSYQCCQTCNHHAQPLVLIEDLECKLSAQHSPLFSSFSTSPNTTLLNNS